MGIPDRQLLLMTVVVTAAASAVAFLSSGGDWVATLASEAGATPERDEPDMSRELVDREATLAAQIEILRRMGEALFGGAPASLETAE